MTSRERLHAVLHGRSYDRTPWALWRHLPSVEGDAAFVTAQISDWLAAGYDVGKINLPSTFCLLDYGLTTCRSHDPFGRPTILKRPVGNASDWKTLKPLTPDAGHLAGFAHVVEEILHKAPATLPVWVPVFSPLSQMQMLAGEEALASQWAEFPDAVLDGMEVIAESTALWMKRIRRLRPDGWYFIIKENSRSGLGPGLLSAADALNRRLVAEHANGLDAVHLHGPDADVRHHLDFPAAVLHWNEAETGISLADPGQQFSGIVAGGLAWPDAPWDPAQIGRLARAGIARLGTASRWMLAPGCVIPCATPTPIIDALRDAVHGRQTTSRGPSGDLVTKSSQEQGCMRGGGW